MSGHSARASASRPHPAVAERRREIARAQGRRRRSVLLIGLGTLTVLAVIYWMVTGPLLAVHGVSVSGYDRPDGEELAAALRDAAAGGTVVSPPADRMRTVAREFPWVESISVDRRWPRALSVRVVEATPVAVAAFEDQAVLLSSAGRVLGVKDGSPGLGWLRLGESPPPEGGFLRPDMRAALAFIAAAKPETAARVRALHITKYGLIEGKLTAGPEVRLGAPERMEAKAHVLGLMLANLSPEQEAEASYIELSVPENPAVGGLS